MVTLRKAIVLVGVTCVLLTAFGIVNLDDGDDLNTPTLVLAVSRNTAPASTRGRMPSLIQITVVVDTTPISQYRTTERVFDLLSRNCRSNLQSFCLLRC